MKKIISLLIACVVGLITATAQINSYSFAYTAGTYSEISGGTVVYSGAALGESSLSLENYAFASGRTLTNEIADVSGFPIGFNFNFGAQTFTHFVVSPNGFIYLGSSEPFKVDATSTTSVLVDDNRFTEGALNVLGFTRTTAWNKANADTEISYLLSGETGSRTLTVQFKKIILTLSTEVAFDIQIKLYEADSKVELVFSGFQAQSEFAWAEVGLKGDAAGNTKFLTRLAGNADTPQNWSAATAGVTGNFSLRYTVCDSGTTFTFTPPPACEAPTNKPTALQLTATSNSINGSFTAAEGVDKYLVLMTKEEISMIATDDKPAQDVTYNIGDIINNKWIVVAFSSNTTFSVGNLDGATEYLFALYSANTECMNGPKYSIIGPPTQDEIKTLPGAPQLSSEGGFRSLTLAAQADADNNPIIVAVNTGQWAIDNLYNQTNDGVFGTPTTDVNVGDRLAGGGTVIYKGPASNAIEVTGLKPNKLINFAAWSYSETLDTLSTTVNKFNITTWGELPYFLDFSQYKAYDIPESWEQEGENFQLTQNSTTQRGNLLEARITTASPENPVYSSVATQYIVTTEGNSRLVLSGKLTVTTGSTPVFTTVGYNDWHEKDSMVFSVKKFGENEYVPVLTIKKDNAQNFFPDASAAGLYSNITIPIEGLSNDTIQVKLAWTTHKAGTLLWDITKFIIEEKPLYEAPVNLTVNPASIVGSQATITWEKHATGTESAWEVRYRPINSETWSTPVETGETNYTFTTLPTEATVEVAVRAVVGLNLYSPWSFPPITFKTGYGLPYGENFDSYASSAAFTANSGWTLSSTLILWNSLALRFRLNQTSPPVTASALLPKLDFGDGSANYKLAFSLSKSGTVPDNDSIYVIDKTAEEEIILKKYSNTVSGNDTIVLEGFTGIKQLGFKVIENTRNTMAYFFLDDVSIFPTCPVAVTGAQASDITTDEAKVSWEGEAEEWLVFIRKAGETTKDFVVRTEKDSLFTGLEEATTYEVGITTSCAPGDTAKVTIVSFTTLTTIPCAQVTDIEATATTGSITLTWVSEAPQFKVRFREAGAETWTAERSIEGATTTTFIGLTHNTTYEYAIQTICSSAEGDFSDYTVVATIKTEEITCFQPTNIVADPLGYRSATLNWEGEATNYELSWAKSSEDWTVVIVNAKSYDLSNLTPQTSYKAQVRSICAEGDTSVYSPVYNFTTAAVPVCPIPTNLTAASITAHSAVLSWTANAANTSWDVRYRNSTVQDWTDTLALPNPSCELTGLVENTTYLWRVKAHCAETENESAYASQTNFSTIGTGIGSVSGDALKVVVSQYAVSVSNPENAYIERIRLYAIDGSLLQDFSVRSSDNVLIPTAITQKIAIVKVSGKDTQAVFKVAVKK
ncbi:MAG: fibronectin type III domain-containing protein [Dysgonamonadaceae bacterium]|jgi:hypothetical protein|nr:fibronectin type III domain-containing protein [Dysgonamonadaceae bacterium]